MIPARHRRAVFEWLARRSALTGLRAHDLMRRVADDDEDPGRRQYGEGATLPVYPASPQTTLGEARMLAEISGNLPGVPIVLEHRLTGWVDVAGASRELVDQDAPVFALARVEPPTVELTARGPRVERRLRRAGPLCVVSRSGLLWGVVTRESLGAALRRARERAKSEAEP